MILQVGVKILLSNGDGKYLLVRRSSEKYKGVNGHWDIVGGRIEPGSRLLENLKREVREETQLEINGEPKLVYAQDIMPNQDKHVVRLTYVGKTSGEPILDIAENVEYKWLTLEEIKNHADLDVYFKEVLDKGLIT